MLWSALIGLGDRVVSLRGVKDLHLGSIDILTDPEERTSSTTVFGYTLYQEGRDRREKKLYHALSLDTNEHLAAKRQEVDDFTRHIAQGELSEAPPDFKETGDYVPATKNGLKWKLNQLDAQFTDLVQSLTSFQVDGEQILKGLKARQDLQLEGFKLVRNYNGGWDVHNSFKTFDGSTLKQEVGIADFLLDVIWQRIQSH